MGHCHKNDVDCVSAETIYQHVWKDKKDNGDLSQRLCRKGRRHKKRVAINKGLGQIPNRVCINKRPPVVDEKLRWRP